MSALPMLPQPAGAAAVPRFMPLRGDSMAPTIGPDHVLAVVPAEGYSGEGLYVLEMLPGGCEVRRCSGDFRGGVRLGLDNPRYQSPSVSVADFERWVIGKVVAVIQVLDRQAVGLPM